MHLRQTTLMLKCAKLCCFFFRCFFSYFCFSCFLFDCCGSNFENPPSTSVLASNSPYTPSKQNGQLFSIRTVNSSSPVPKKSAKLLDMFGTIRICSPPRAPDENEELVTTTDIPDTSSRYSPLLPITHMAYTPHLPHTLLTPQTPSKLSQH